MASSAGSARLAEPARHRHRHRHRPRLVSGKGAITILRRGLAALWVASLVTVVLLAVATSLGPKLGIEVFAIRGGSMAPTIPLGAAVVAVHTAPDAIRLGDVVTIRADNGVVFTHRVVEIDDSESDVWLRTKGDANTTGDPAPVPPASVVGVVSVTIPLAGYLMALLATPAGNVSFLAYAVALLLAIWELEEAGVATHKDRRLHGTTDVARA